MHEGESCYIIGDGVSLKYFDLLSLPIRKILALNLSIFHKEVDQTGFDYAFMTSSFHFIPFIEKISLLNEDFKHGSICRHYKQKYFKNTNSNFFVNISNYPFTIKKNVFHLFQHLPLQDFAFGNECLVAGESMCAGSLRYGISMSIYMGFSEIFLLGCDYTHADSRIGHWYEFGEGIPCPHPEYSKKFFNLASKYANITTVTSSGIGSVLPSITYQKLTGTELHFRENSELTHPSNLKVFSNWPGYNI